MATQWHKRILSDSSLELEELTTSSYQGCISREYVGKWIHYFLSERQWCQRGKEKKKKNLIGLLFYGLTSLGVSLSEAYPTQYCFNREPGISWSVGRSPGWNVTASWRMNPWAGQSRSVFWKLGPWAGQGMSTSWDSWTGGSPTRLRHDKLLRARSLGRSTSWDLQTGIPCLQGLQPDQWWAGLRGCNLNSLLAFSTVDRNRYHDVKQPKPVPWDWETGETAISFVLLFLWGNVSHWFPVSIRAV